MKKIGSAVLTFILCGLIALLCAMSDTAKEGAQKGIKMCEEIIIPSLLPILIISNIIIKTSCSKVFEKLFGKVFKTLFNIPPICAAAVIAGLTGGFPAGAVLTLELSKSGAIDKTVSQRLIRFNFCGGCAFIITAVGTVTYGSTKTGLILYLSNIFSSIIIMFLTRNSVPITLSNAKTDYCGFSEALSASAEATVKAIALMAAYIVLFSALCNIVNPPAALVPLFEITNGICFSKPLLPLEYCAFFLSFGGICIHFQLIGFLKEMKVNYFDFLVYRMFSALLSFALMKIYLYFFPQQAEVFFNLSSPAHEFSNGGLSLSLVMIVGCAVLIFDIENRKLKLI